MPTSAQLTARRRAAVARGVGTVIDAYVDHAGPATLVDVDGRQWIDFGSGIAVTSAGNAAPAVVEAVREQAGRFIHTCFQVAPYQGYIEVCEHLNELAPGAFDKRSALFNSGAEAVENAIKIARCATGRPAVIAFDHAFHGRTAMAMALTARAMPYKHGFGPFPPEVYHMPGSYPLRDGGRSGARAAAEAIDRIETQVCADRVAAVIVEPIQGEGGFVVPAPGFLPALREWTTGAGIALIIDEIQTGLCRTGDWFACQHEGVEPDLITTGKALAGGLPLAAVTGRAEIMDQVHVGGLGSTFGGNPVCCAAALATIRTMHAGDLAAAARRIESVLLPRLRALAARQPRIAEVRGRGAMLALELVLPGTLEPDPATTTAISRGCHEAGLLTLTCGSHGNVLRLLPPLVIGEDLLRRGLDILDGVVADLA